MKVLELRALAKKKGLTGYSKLRKAELEKLLDVNDDTIPLKTLKLLKKLISDSPWIIMLGIKKTGKDNFKIIAFEPSGRGEASFTVGTISTRDSNLNKLYSSFSYLNINKNLKKTFHLGETFDSLYKDYEHGKEKRINLEDKIARLVMKSEGLNQTDAFKETFYTGVEINGEKTSTAIFLEKHKSPVKHKNLQDMTVLELRKLAEHKKIKLHYKWRKNDIIKALRTPTPSHKTPTPTPTPSYKNQYTYCEEGCITEGSAKEKELLNKGYSRSGNKLTKKKNKMPVLRMHVHEGIEAAMEHLDIREVDGDARQYLSDLLNDYMERLFSVMGDKLDCDNVIRAVREITNNNELGKRSAVEIYKNKSKAENKKLKFKLLDENTLFAACLEGALYHLLHEILELAGLIDSQTITKNIIKIAMRGDVDLSEIFHL